MFRACIRRARASAQAVVTAKSIPSDHIISSSGNSNCFEHHHQQHSVEHHQQHSVEVSRQINNDNNDVLGSLQLQPGQIVVRNSFLGLNTVDQSLWDQFDPRPSGPQTQEGSGTVMKCGPNVDASAWMGKRVAFFKSIGGSYSSFSVADASDLFLIPDGVSDEIAAAVMLQGCTAHYLSHDCFNCRPGTTVVVHSAAGGTGILLSQFAKLRGATVIGLCGKHKGSVAKEIGQCDFVFELTSRRRWVDDVRSVVPEGVDAVYDGVGRSTFEGSLSVLKRRGSMISFGNASGVVPPVAPLDLTRHGSITLQRPTLRDYASKEGGEIDKRVADVFEAIREGKLNVHIGHTIPLAQAPQAHELIESGQSTGKILIRCLE